MLSAYPRRRPFAGPARWVGPALLLFLLLPACHAYRPVVGEDPVMGDAVRLRLSAPTSAQLSERVGTPLRSVEGYLLRVNPDTLVVDVGWGAVYAGTVFESRRDTLAFHRSAVLEVDRREFSRGRTALVGGMALSLAIWIVRSLGVGTDTGEPGGGDSPPI